MNSFCIPHLPFLSLVGLFSSGLLCAQGPLTPPGMPTPTMKTLDQLEPRVPIASLPYTISAPGSYYLTANLSAAGGLAGIAITSADVSLDLAGFTINGNGGTGSGIATTSPDLSNVVITGGSVSNWPGQGIDVRTAKNGRVSDVLVNNNGGVGLWTGQGYVIQRCNAVGNQGLGGISGGVGSLIADCLASGNGQDGIRAGTASVVRHCVSIQNGNDGIYTGAAQVIDCSVQINTGDGIEVSSRSMVKNNLARLNGINGTGAGIHVTGSYSHVADNQVTENDWGILVEDIRNVVIRNFASVNGTNFSVVANNTVGTILVTPASGAINGSSGGAGLGSTDPWANFAF